MYIGNNAAIRGCQEYFNRCASAGSPIGATQTPSSYDNAASFNGTNQFLSRASNSTLTVTGTSFTFAFWANTPNTSNGMVISKTASTDTREFQIGLDTGGVAQFRLFPDGTSANSRVISSSASSFSANTWNFFVCRYDSSAATIGISVNGGAFTSLGSIPAITQTNTNPLNFGVFVNTSGGLNYTGQLAGVGFWKKALTPSEVTALFNNSAGRTYASLDTGLRTDLVSWWALNQNSVTADSAPTGNNLTNNGTPLVTATTLGPIVTSLADPRQLIVDFAQGIDQLGLWNSMVCWPMRASQNAGSGLTAFSLGGLGQFNGTLAGSVAPSWTPNGVLNSGGGGQINTTITQAYNAQSIGVVGAQSSPTSGFSYFGGTNASSEALYWMNPRSGFGGEFRYSGSNIFVGDTSDVTFSLWSTLGSVGSQTTAYKNNVLIGTATPNAVTPTSTTLATGLTLGRSNGVFQGTQAFVFVLSVRLSPSDYVLLYTLYRQTLGLGLGLP
jgi:hypothetical protein